MVLDMKKGFFVLMVVLSVFIAGCQSMTFDQGIARIVEINSAHGSTMESYPADPAVIDEMIVQLNDLQKSSFSDGKEQMDLALRYRILTLESGKPLLAAADIGGVGITQDGFSCKPKPMTLRAASLRDQSAQKSFEAVTVLKELVEKYPQDAQKLGLSMKTALFQNATAYAVWEQGAKDARTIDRYCPDEKVLELYKEEFRKKGIMAEEELSALTYEQAAEKWLEIRGD
jgi:hypothetical protein